MGKWLVAVGIAFGSSAVTGDDPASAGMFPPTLSLPHEGGGESDDDGTLAKRWPRLRIDSELYVNGRKQGVAPRSLFDGGKVYDYLNGPKEVTIFEPVERRFTLYHGERGVACRVSFLQIEQHLEQRRARALEAVKQAEGQGSALAARVRWHWEPTFQEIYDPQLGELKLKGPYATYTIRGVPIERFESGSRGVEDEGTVATALLSYWDWYARLNARLNPQALPPAARLEVNARLIEHELVPEQVELRLLFGQETTVRTTHETTVGLRREDRRRIDETRRGLSEARMVSLEEYLVETANGGR